MIPSRDQDAADHGEPTARIVLVEGTTPAGSSDTFTALERLGDEVEIVCTADPLAALTVCERHAVDCVVVDVPPAARSPILEALRSDGPPAVVVCRSENEREAVEAFAEGASDCVRHGPDYENVLPAVVLEQLHRFQKERDRGAAESRIRWLEGFNDAIVGAIPAALAVVDGRDRIVAINPEFARLFDVQAADAIDRRYTEVLPGDLVESGELRALLAASAADRAAAPRLARTRGADPGRARTFDVRARRLDDEGRLLLLLSDVSERERLTRRVEELRRYNENIIHNMNSALMVVDETGRIRFANSTAEDLLGAPPDGLRDRSAWDWFGAGHPERGLLLRTLEEGVRFKGAETVVRRDDGSVVPVGISCAPLVDAQGRRGAVAIFQDLTEIKQLQRQVLQTEKMASIGQLAAGVAHEINNPMGFIHANLFQMAEYLGDLRRVWGKVDDLRKAVAADPASAIRDAVEDLGRLASELDVQYVLDDFEKAIRESQEGSERIRHIVQDLRDFSHQDTGEREPADVNQCVDSTASIVWTMMKHSVVLQKEYRDLPPVECFPMQLKQVFMNLLVNAYQAIDARIGGTGETGEIRIRTDRDGEMVVVSIEDTGIGIPAEDIPRIFDPFFTTKEVGSGTGLGLSTSFSIVQRHGGTIRVESRPGAGSRFEVRLPIRAPRTDAAKGRRDRRG